MVSINLASEKCVLDSAQHLVLRKIELSPTRGKKLNGTRPIKQFNKNCLTPTEKLNSVKKRPRGFKQREEK